MKKSLLLLCILLSAFHRHSFAQNISIDSFYTPGTTWTEADFFHNGDSKDPYSGARKIVYKIEKDTFVAATKYYQVSMSNLGSFTFPFLSYTFSNSSPPVFSSSPNTKDIIGRIRIDSNRVFFTRDIAGGEYEYSGFTLDSEYVLYDFNLSLGTTPYLSNIDSVALSNGVYIKSYAFGSYNQQWLQGIGDVDGLISFVRLTNGPWTYMLYTNALLLCYDNPSFSYHPQYPAETLYGDLQYNCFDMTTLGVNNTTLQASGITIFPNPVKDDLINFEGADLNEVNKATIYDITGKELYTFPKPFTGGSTSLSATLNAGIYLIKLESPSGTITKKITRL